MAAAISCATATLYLLALAEIVHAASTPVLVDPVMAEAAAAATGGMESLAGYTVDPDKPCGVNAALPPASSCAPRSLTPLPLACSNGRSGARSNVPWGRGEEW